MFGSPLYTWGLISSTVYGGENFSARNHKKVEGGKIETLCELTGGLPPVRFRILLDFSPIWKLKRS
jgi:hypothetical protein